MTKEQFDNKLWTKGAKVRIIRDVDFCHYEVVTVNFQSGTLGLEIMTGNLLFINFLECEFV